MLASTIAVLLDAIKLILSYNGVMIISVLNNWLLTNIFLWKISTSTISLGVRRNKQAHTYIPSMQCYGGLWPRPS
jgi:hypothetical protein